MHLQLPHFAVTYSTDWKWEFGFLDILCKAVLILKPSFSSAEKLVDGCGLSPCGNYESGLHPDSTALNPFLQLIHTKSSNHISLFLLQADLYTKCFAISKSTNSC